MYKNHLITENFYQSQLENNLIRFHINEVKLFMFMAVEQTEIIIMAR